MKKIMFDDHYGLTKAVLEGTKTMTRRIIYDFSNYGWGSVIDAFIENGVLYFDTGLPSLFAPKELQPKYNIGEVIAVAQPYKDLGISECLTVAKRIRLANGHSAYEFGKVTESAGWRNKMFVRPTLMPNRIRITSIKVERLQGISEEECLREGVYHEPIDLEDHDGLSYYASGYAFNGSKMCYNSPRDAFAALIDKISGKGTWEKNPWVFVYSFKLVK